GIVGDVKQEALAADGLSPTIYRAAWQQKFEPRSLVVRTATPPQTQVGAIRQVIEQLNPEQPVRNVRTMQEIVDESIADRRISMLLLAGFAGLALLLAASGLYSVLAYSVRRRVREIGIRLALGAEIPDVLGMVASESLRPTIAGMVIGLAGS